MNTLNTSEVVLRLSLAVAAGLILGFERERHGRAAGMRTTMLVCVASAIAMVLSEHLFWQSSNPDDSWHPDPARLAAGVLAGMGFLGAGVILRQENAIHGVTTAAVLWFSAILGMSLGSGYFLLGGISFGIAILALFILPSVERYIPVDRYAALWISSSLPGPSQNEVIQAVEGLKLGASIRFVGLEQDLTSRSRQMHFELKVKKGHWAECERRSVELIQKFKGVKHVKWA
jgi:putative Mg2+ transporter-C (MgtC) family protein